MGSMNSTITSYLMDGYRVLLGPKSRNKDGELMMLVSVRFKNFRVEKKILCDDLEDDQDSLLIDTVEELADHIEDIKRKI